MIVDDSPDNLEMLKTLLTFGGGLEVIEARSGKAALEILGVQDVDIVISDYEMNDGDGLWLLKKVQSLPLRPHFILFSGQISLSENAVLSAGANAFFSKPYSIRDLIVYVQNISGR